MMEGDNKIDVAYFEVNAHGRILSGNRRFCRMFGYSESEVVWHYITDFYRYLKEWEDFRDCVDEARHSFVARMRNRKGRSFKCSVTREVVQDSEGHVTFRSYVTRLGEHPRRDPHARALRQLRRKGLPRGVQPGRRAGVGQVPRRYKTINFSYTHQKLPAGHDGEFFNLATSFRKIYLEFG